MFMSSTVEASVSMGKKYSDNLHSIKNTGENLTLKKMFEISEQLMLEQSDDFLKCLKSAGKILHGRLSLVNDESLACKGFCILRFCVMSWKGESEPNIKHCLGTTVGLVQRFITIQNFGHNRQRIRVKHFPRIHHIAACP